MFCTEFYCGHPKNEHNAKHGCTHVNLVWKNGLPETHVCLCYASYGIENSFDMNPPTVVVTHIGNNEIIL